MLGCFLLGAVFSAGGALVPGHYQQNPSVDSAARALVPVSAASEFVLIRKLERAGERFFALVGPDYRSRLLREKPAFGVETADSNPAGALSAGGVFSLAINPDRRLAERLLRPRLIRSSLLPDVLAALWNPSYTGTARSVVSATGRDAQPDIRSNFTIEFLCHLRRASSTANDASDVPSSPNFRIVV